MWPKLLGGNPLKSALIRVSIDPQPYPHNTNERDGTYGRPLSPIIRRHFSQLIFQYYYDSRTGLLTDIEIGCFEGKNVKNHDESRHKAIVQILHEIKTLFMYRGIRCTVIHVLDTEMSFRDYTIMSAQKDIQSVDDDTRPPIPCQEDGLVIICPNCNKSTELVTRADYPRDEDLDEDIQMDGDLVEPDMTREFYEHVSKERGITNQEKIVGPIVVAMVKDHGKCPYSNKNVLVIFYTIFKHDARVGGVTFRIIRIFNDGEKIKNVYEA